jgi:hypothetical protein
MSILGIIERHQKTASSPCVKSVNSSISPPEDPFSRLKSFSRKCAGEVCQEEAKAILTWLEKYIRGHYPLLAVVKKAAMEAGFAEEDVAETLKSYRFVTYKTFPYRNGEREHIRHIDDWPDDPCLRGRFGQAGGSP